MTLDELGQEQSTKPKVLQTTSQSRSDSVAVDDEVVPWRPQLRCATPLLIVLDDGSRTQGEVVRLRSKVTEIGRVKGNIVIPQDPDISSLHVAIERTGEYPSHRFRLRDLESTNGTFVRQESVPLLHDRELILGSRRYRWLETNSPGRSGATLLRVDDGWKFELQPGRVYHVGRRVMTSNNTQSRNESRIEIQDDPFLSLHHATIEQRDKEGHRLAWDISDHASVNGLWCRVQEAWLDGPTEFVCGEQRFLFRYP